MKTQYRLFKRSSGIFFIQNNVTGKQESLRTRDKNDAKRLFAARNEAHQQPAINLQIARAYLAATDPQIGKRTWQDAMDEAGKLKPGPTQERWKRAMTDKAFDSIRQVTILETRPEHFVRALEKGNHLRTEQSNLFSGISTRLEQVSQKPSNTTMPVAIVGLLLIPIGILFSLSSDAKKLDAYLRGVEATCNEATSSWRTRASAGVEPATAKFRVALESWQRNESIAGRPLPEIREQLESAEEEAAQLAQEVESNLEKAEQRLKDSQDAFQSAQSIFRTAASKKQGLFSPGRIRTLARRVTPPACGAASGLQGTVCRAESFGCCIV